MSLPTVVITGSSGFVGRHLLEAWKERYRIFGLARRSQVRSGAPTHPNITWFETDIADRRAVEAAFAHVREQGGAELVVHLAAHYDFTGEEHPQYWRTNVDGLRNVLESCRLLHPRHFVFSSSVAACRLPPPGGALDEHSPADGVHVYARTKHQGEQMVREYQQHFPATIVRFAALFSDWCEYPPLFKFLETWLSSAWNARLLGGRGQSAIPYLHVKDLVLFFERLLPRLPELSPGEVLIASPDGCSAHAELYEEATRLYFGQRRPPWHMPRLLCGPGMWARDLAGRLLGERPFERPWMAEYIDTRMNIDARRTRARLGWEPRPRLAILRRLPFLIEHLKADPLEWHTRNRAALKEARVLNNLVIHRLLELHEEAITGEYTAVLLGPDGPRRFPSYQALSPDEHAWNHRVILRHLMNAVRTRDKGVFLGYVRDLAERRFEQGYRSHELCDALRELNRICFKILRRDRNSDGLQADLREDVTMTLQFACDLAQDVFETLEAQGGGPPR